MRSKCLHKSGFFLALFASFFLSLLFTLCLKNDTYALSGIHNAGAIIKYYPDSVIPTNVTSNGQMLLYPTVDQYAGIMRFYFYPVIPAGTGYGLLIKDVDLSFYIDDDGVFTVDNSFCNHIGFGGLPSSFSSTISNCAVYFADGTDGNTYIHFHFNMYLQSPASAVISNDASFYITVGTYEYNETQDSPIVKRSIVFANLPLYFNGLSIANISLQTSASDSLLEQNNALLNDISNKLDNFQDDEQQKYEDQSQAVQDDLNDVNEGSISQGNNLISIISAFFDLIKNTPPAPDCSIFLDFRLYGGSRYSANICQQGAINFLNLRRSTFVSGSGLYTTIYTVIVTFVFGVIIIRLAISTLSVMKKIYEEFRK